MPSPLTLPLVHDNGKEADPIHVESFIFLSSLLFTLWMIPLCLILFYECSLPKKSLIGEHVLVLYLFSFCGRRMAHGSWSMVQDFLMVLARSVSVMGFGPSNAWAHACSLDIEFVLCSMPIRDLLCGLGLGQPDRKIVVGAPADSEEIHPILGAFWHHKLILYHQLLWYI
jgi:hypothetical protein